MFLNNTTLDIDEVTKCVLHHAIVELLFQSWIKYVLYNNTIYYWISSYQVNQYYQCLHPMVAGLLGEVVWTTNSQAKNCASSLDLLTAPPPDTLRPNCIISTNKSTSCLGEGRKTCSQQNLHCQKGEQKRISNSTIFLELSFS